MISIKDLTVKFGDHTVLDHIDINFRSPGVHGIVGLNGAGKTTFFNTVTKILKADQGSMMYNGNVLNRKDFAYLETTNYFYSRITGNEYLKIFKQTNTNFKLQPLQDFLRLPLDELIENYSTGMKKKLALLALLKQDKSIYLLDEPFNGLDLESNKILEMIMLGFKQKNKTVFVSSHIIDPLLTVCDEIHFLERGSFKKTYTKNDFNRIEEELFGELKDQMRTVINKSI